MREGWTYKKLGEVGRIITGSTPSTKDADNYNSNDVCFVKPSDIPKNGIGLLYNSEFYISKKAYNNSRKLPQGSVLTTCIGIIGKVCILKTDATCNQQINAIIPHSGISSTFLAYTILSKRHYLEHIANAPVVPIINKKEFSNTTISVPPLTEQERIVSELDLLFGVIEKKKAQLEEYDQLAQSIFYDMFGDILNSTPTQTLKNIASYYIGLTYKPSDVSEEGTIILRSSNIQNSLLDFEDTVRVNVEIKDNKYVQDGDILMCARNGSARLVGKVAKIKNISEKMSFGAFMTIIRSKYNEYLFHFFLSDYFRNQLVTSKTATINQITTRMLDNIKLNVPPLSLQQQFAEKIEAIEKQKEQIKQSIAEVETLFNSRMDYYFG